MSAHKLAAVKHALKVLRAAGGGPLTMDEVSALEACAVSQAELLKSLKELVETIDSLGALRVPKMDRARKVIEEAERE